ncbi:hypothetical protein BASA62_004171 [Batrachochytrium salamandrivorans]|nr:hypothetical protein BASA62_004171 [Batrachochytrium salamandrivorans]
MYGPQMPPGHSKHPPTSSTVGNESDSETDDNVFGPSLPPGLATARTLPVEQPSASPLGSDTHTNSGSRGSHWQSHGDDDDDDHYGPLPLNISSEEIRERERVERIQEIEARLGRTGDMHAPITKKETPGKKSDHKDGAIQREDWMTVPPEAMRLESGPQMASRQFSATVKERTVDQTLWTESPGERAKRILGSKDKKQKSAIPDDPPRIPSVEEQETSEFIARHNAVHRPKSLLQDFTLDYVKSSKFDDDDASKRMFDRDKDVVSRRIDAKSRKRLLDDAQKLDSKFSSGKQSYL